MIKNFENKAFVSLQRYMVLITASRILRKFLFLSEDEQSKLIWEIVNHPKQERDLSKMSLE